MLISAKVFFENLAAKSCSTCGQPLEEQADCYPNTCDSCTGTPYYTFNLETEKD